MNNPSINNEVVPGTFLKYPKITPPNNMIEDMIKFHKAASIFPKGLSFLIAFYFFFCFFI
jgi:hypothetical protein